MTKRSAIYKALDELGGRTEMMTLANRVFDIYGNDDISIGYINIVRTEWRRENGIEVDCRTYEGQPRRNMQNDTVFNAKQQRKLDKLTGQQRRMIREFISDFHSIEQVLHGVRPLAQLRVAA